MLENVLPERVQHYKRFSSEDTQNETVNNEVKLIKVFRDKGFDNIIKYETNNLIDVPSED